MSQTLQTNTVEAISIFTGLAIAQYIIPAPLDSLLFPGAVTFWWIHSGQKHWIVDEMTNRTSNVLNHIGKYWNETVTKRTEKEQEPL